MTFDQHIGIDYSGRETPISRTSGSQVYAVSGGKEPRAIRPPKAPSGVKRNWCRKEIAEWIIGQARSKGTSLVRNRYAKQNRTAGQQLCAVLGKCRWDAVCQFFHSRVLSDSRKGTWVRNGHYLVYKAGQCDRLRLPA